MNNNRNINKNIITSNGQSYSNYIYTFTIRQSYDGSDPLCLLPYQIETNQAFQEHLDGTENILDRFKNALTLEENYITIMNMCVISLAQRRLEDIEDLALKAKNYSNGQTHHIILLVEFYLLIHDDEKAIKHLIELFIQKEQQDVVLALLKEVFSRKIYSIEHLSNLRQKKCSFTIKYHELSNKTLISLIFVRQSLLNQIEDNLKNISVSQCIIPQT